MEQKHLIFNKLASFCRKYYTNELIRGIFLFLGIGFLYFLFTLLVEHFLWLEPMYRSILFWLFVAIASYLLVRLILFPIFKIFKLKRGINFDQASTIIGAHFPEIGDKLLNFLQLSSHQSHQSELLQASIDQKALQLSPFHFSTAVSFKSNYKYLPLALIPLLFLGFLLLSGQSQWFLSSMDRVVRYSERFEPPAPFSFVLQNQSLAVEKGSDFNLLVSTVGNVVPENASISIGDETYFLNPGRIPGTFEFVFQNVQKPIAFQLFSNGVSSLPFVLDVKDMPTIHDFAMTLVYPSYTGKGVEIIKGTGNAIVPEGTKVTWNIKADATSKILFNAQDISKAFRFDNNQFSYQQTIIQNTEYQVVTNTIEDLPFDELSYKITTIKDQFPSISVVQAPDSLETKSHTFIGQVSDDYGLSKLQLVYYPLQRPDQAKFLSLAVAQDVFDQFIYSFPSQLSLDPGIHYEYYFEVFDNDRVNKFKSAKSQVFSTKILTQDEIKQQLLVDKNANINAFQQSISTQQKQLSELENFTKQQKQKDQLAYKDRQKLDDFLQRQQRQEEMMQTFTKKLKDNLDAFNPKDKTEEQKALESRLEQAKKESERDQKLLEELEKLSEKMQDMDLFDKIDQMKSKSQAKMKNLESLVEMTKRFYVSKKAEQLANKLGELGDKQDKLSTSEENSAAEQNKLNDAFKELSDELRDLEKENKSLKAPMQIPSDEKQEESIKQDQKSATDALQKDSSQEAAKKQKSAAEKMKQMSQQMMQSMGGGAMDQMEEDVSMLRQILDNLLAFSFSQESLLKTFKNLKKGDPSYNTHLKRQQDLKIQFKHIDDSLFALSLRNPKITDIVANEVGKIYYNVDKSLDNFAEAYIPKGVSHQQYAVTSANTLADFLSEVLNNMQMELSGMGNPSPKQGKGQGQQLPDIIQKQQGLSEQVKEGMEKGEQEGEGKEGPNGKPQNQQGSSKGKQGSGTSGDGEENARELMEIYKQQNELRRQLENALQKEGLTPDGKRILEQMKDVEKSILNKGFNNELFQKMLNIKQQMLKLEQAIQQQDEDNKRESNAGKNNDPNSLNALSPALKEYLNSIEILNRQSLPLQPNFKQKVQSYFKTND